MNSQVALVGEVEENPSVLGFETLQERLVQVLGELNREHAPTLLFPLAAPGGFPEFVAVLGDLSLSYRLARALAETFHPLSVRVAAAYGLVNVPPPGEEPEQVDGPAMDLAAELLYRARKEDRLLVVQSGNEAVDRLVNTLTLVLYRDLQEWTARQCEVVRLYRRLGRQTEVAQHLRVSQQSVSGSLAGARWRTLTEAERVLDQALSALGSPETPSPDPGLDR